MTTTRAAKYLNGADIGKTIELPTRPLRLTATIAQVEHTSDYTRVLLDPPAQNGVHTLTLRNTVEVTLTGEPSPPTTDPHGLNTRKGQR